MHMTSKKWLALLLSSLICLSLLAGCAPAPQVSTPPASDSPSAPATSAPAQNESTPAPEQKTLDFIWFSDGLEGEVTQSIINEYETLNPHIKINMIEVPYNDLDTTLRTSISGGEPPAIARVTYVGGYKDVAVSFDDYLDATAFKAQFSESLQPFYVYDDKVKGVPIDVTANGLIYNKTAFEKAGVTVPASPDEVWTVEEWIDAMKQVMERGGVQYGLVVDKTPHRFSTLLYEYGGRILSEDQKSCVINSPEGVATVDLMKRLHDEGISPASVWVGSENPNELFRSGQVAMHLAGSWMMTNYRDNITDFEWGVTYLPKATTRSSVPGGKYLMVFDNTGVEQEAVDFVNYFTSKEASAKYCSESLFISPRKDLADMEFSFASDYFKIFANELDNSTMNAAKDWSHPTMSGAIKDILLDGIGRVITGTETAQDMLDRVAASVTEEINR